MLTHMSTHTTHVLTRLEQYICDTTLFMKLFTTLFTLFMTLCANSDYVHAIPSIKCNRTNTCCNHTYPLWTIDIQRDVEYGTATLAIQGQTPVQQRLMLDIYSSHMAARPMPVIVWVHGGAYMTTSTKDDNGPTTSYARRWARAGFIVFSIEYRRHGILTTTVTVTDPVLDTLTAVAWIRANAVALGADINSIGLSGCSAGAVTVGHANFFGSNLPGAPRSSWNPPFHYVISISGGILPNGTVEQGNFPWPLTRYNDQIDPYLGIVAVNDTTAPGVAPPIRENMTARELQSRGVEQYLITLTGNVHCPLENHIDPWGNPLFDTMLSFALKNTPNVTCTDFQRPVCQEQSCVNTSVVNATPVNETPCTTHPTASIVYVESVDPNWPAVFCVGITTLIGVTACCFWLRTAFRP